MGTMFRPASFISLPPPELTQLDIEAFFSKYRSLVTPLEFEKIHELVVKTRPSRGNRYYISSSDGKLDFEHEIYARMDAQRSQDADLSKMEVIVVEDVDVRCLVALDAAYQLDPQFLLAYTGVGDKHSPDLEAVNDPTDMAVKWYVTEMSMLLEFPWQVEDSRIVEKFAKMEKPWYTTLLPSRHTAGTEATKPWWKEAVRTDCRLTITTVRSKIACYCLTDKLRESRRIDGSLAANRR